MGGPKKLTIDTDPGTDDAIALLMALGAQRAGQVEIVGVTTVGGNASLARTTRNALAILEYGERPDIPVAKGASRPLSGRYPYSYRVHGSGGLTVRLPRPALQVRPEPAAELLRAGLESSDEGITLVALGPLTNVARFLRTHPQAARGLAELVVMGGAVAVPGNVTPHAEFNFYSDRRAAKEVLSSGLPVTLVDLKACQDAVVEREVADGLLRGGPGARLAGRILDNWFRRHPEYEEYHLYDPLATAAALEPGILETRRSHIVVDPGPGDRAGETTCADDDGSVAMPISVDVQRFREVLHDTLH